MLVRYGGGVLDASGSVGGQTHARNRFGPYVRARTKPVNPNTARQQAVRAAIANLADRWSQILTAAQRVAWNLYANSVVMKNRLGQDIHLTGFNHYIRSNSLLIQVGGTLVDDGPTVFELPTKDPTLAITASEGTQLVSVAFDDTMAWLDLDEAYLHVKLGQPQNPQRYYFNGPWRYMDNIPGDSGTPPTTPATMAVPFVISELQRLWAEARIILPDGRVSEPFQAYCFCAA